MIISSILAFILTFLTFIVFFGSLHIISRATYNHLLNKCNQSPKLMGLSLFITVIIFLVYFLLIFMRQMNGLTSYISEMAGYIKQIATGHLEVQIPIRQHNELSTLAVQINQMAKDLKVLMDKEREWEEQKYNLITNLSHDLKNPLMSIRGFLELICKKKYKDEVMLNHYSQIAFDKSIQLQDSINQLFELSKLSHSNVDVHKTSVNMEELASQVLLSFLPELEKKQLRYGVEMIGHHKMIEVDPNLMVRVFENLIANALKYGVGAHYINITIEENLEREMVLHVCNDGRPIEEGNQKKIFERFYRAEKDEDKKEGSGVGLAVVKAIVSLHQGEIKVISNQVKTDFVITLPHSD